MTLKMKIVRSSEIFVGFYQTAGLDILIILFRVAAARRSDFVTRSSISK
jgi:hypothetical protein